MYNVKQTAAAFARSWMLALGLSVGISIQVSAGEHQPADAPAQQSQALTFVEVDQDALPDEIVEVAISRFTYKPNEITVEPGTTVLWTNEDPVGHNVAFFADNIPDMDQELTGPIVGQEGKFAVRFDEAGRYDYYCTPHPFMKGAVIVE